MKKLTYDEFLDDYKPIKNPIIPDAPFDGYMFELYGKELEWIKKANIKNVWTIVDTDDGLYIMAGYNYVNRFGYFFTENEWKDKDIEIPIYDDYDEYFIDCDVY